MEKDSFEKEDVAKILNDDFIAIKVDREERPDLDNIYMTALESMTGSGGWPMSMFLTPDGKPFFGASTIPHDQFIGILSQIAAIWRSDLAKIRESGAAVTEQLRQYLNPAGAGKSRRDIDQEALISFYNTAESQFDKTYGGFGGGFHRYSVDGKWEVPHFEKMSHDNSGLITAYLEAYQVTGDRDGESSKRAVVSDYAFLIHGLIELYQSDFDPKWFEWALDLQAIQDKDFRDDADGGYFFDDAKDPTLLSRSKDYDDTYRIRADDLIRSAAGRITASPFSYPQTLIALDYALDRSSPSSARRMINARRR